MIEIKLNITKAGIDAISKAEESGLNLRLSQVRFSSDRFESNVNDLRTTINNVVLTAPIASFGKSVDRNTLRFFVVVNAPQDLSVGSVGLFDEDGVLFAVASVSSGELHRLPQNFSVVLSFGLSISALDSNVIHVVIDEQGAIAFGLIIQHEKHENPHPQYAISMGDNQGLINDLINQVNLLENKLNDLQAQNNNNASSRSFNFLTRDLDKNTSTMPAPIGNTSQKGHVLKISVEILPNGYIRQTLLIKMYNMKTNQRFFFPVALNIEDVHSIIGSPWNSTWINDVVFRVIYLGTEVYNGKVQTVFGFTADRVSDSDISPYRGEVDFSVTIVGRHNNLPSLNNLNTYPFSTF